MEWQPIKTAPKDGTHVIIYPNYSRREGRRTYFSRPTKTGEAYWHQPGNPDLPGFWVVAWGPNVKPNPTHWMPLPTPPAPAP